MCIDAAAARSPTRGHSLQLFGDQNDLIVIHNMGFRGDGASGPLDRQKSGARAGEPSLARDHERKLG